MAEPQSPSPLSLAVDLIGLQVAHIQKAADAPRGRVNFGRAKFRSRVGNDLKMSKRLTDSVKSHY